MTTEKRIEATIEKWNSKFHLEHQKSIDEVNELAQDLATQEKERMKEVLEGLKYNFKSKPRDEYERGIVEGTKRANKRIDQTISNLEEG